MLTPPSRKSEFLDLSQITPILKDLIDNATFADPTDGDGATKKPRPVVLVFHESSADVKYLKQLSYHAEDAPNVADVVDTREMHQFLVRSNDSASLASVLGHLGIAHAHLHNAGNDAVYTLQAMIGLAVRKRAMSLENKKAAE
jgi:DNA polymerase III epsilon subunit-like protein